MKSDPVEDQKDAEEIRKQKREQEQTREEMPSWEFGRGLRREARGNRAVRD